MPSLPFPIKVFLNGPVPNLRPLPKGRGGKHMIGGVQGGSPQHLAPQSLCQVEKGKHKASPHPK